MFEFVAQYVQRLIYCSRYPVRCTCFQSWFELGFFTDQLPSGTSDSAQNGINKVVGHQYVCNSENALQTHSFITAVPAAADQAAPRVWQGQGRAGQGPSCRKLLQSIQCLHVKALWQKKPWTHPTKTLDKTYQNCEHTLSKPYLIGIL